MRGPWLEAQLDYVTLWHGLALLLVALPCRRLMLRARQAGVAVGSEGAWSGLSLFALSWALRCWLCLPGLPPNPLATVPGLAALASLVTAAAVCQWPESSRARRAALPCAAMAAGGVLAWLGLSSAITVLIGGPAALWTAMAMRRRFPQARALCLTLAVYGLLLVASASLRAGWSLAAQYGSVVAALLLMAGAWSLWRRSLESEVETLGRRATLLLAGVSLAALLLGWAVTIWQGHVADIEARGALLQRAHSLARSMHPPRVQALTFTAADASASVYQRLCGQLQAYHRFLGDARGYYTVAPRGRDLVFGPESYAPTDPQASRPGEVYQRPAPGLQAAIGLRQSVVVGPYHDEYGEFLTAFSPVFEARSGNVLAMVGVDLEAPVWRTQVARARRAGLLCTWLLVASLAMGLYLLHLRAEHGGAAISWLRHAEVIATASVGCSLTLVFGLCFYEHERMSAAGTFEHLASATAEALIAQCEDMRIQLLATARLIQASRDLEVNQFERFVLPFASGASPLWGYAPVAGDKLIVGMAAPMSSARSWLGRDLLADPRQRAVVRRALETGLLCGEVEASTEGPQTYLAYQPVTESPRGRVVGVVFCRFAPQDLVNAVLIRGQTDARSVHAELRDTSAPQGERAQAWAAHARRFERAFAVNVLGRAWVVLIRPASDRVVGHPLRVAWALVLICLTATALIVRFVALLRGRQWALERLVSERTAALAERSEALRVDLHRSLEQQQVLAEVAMLPEVLGGDLLATARICTERAAITLGTARASVWTLEPDADCVECLDAYDADLGCHSSGQVLPMAHVAPLIEAASAVRVLASEPESGRSLLRGAAQEHAAGLHLSALLTTLVRVAGEDRAALLLSYRGKDHQWSSDELAFCGQLADQLSLTITNRERLDAQQVLDQSKREVEAILQSVQACVLVIDAESHTILEANSAACRLIGTPRDELVGRSCHERVCPKQLGQCPITDQGQTVDNAERVVLTADGREVPVLKTVVAIRLRDRDCLLESFVDITAQREQQEQLGQALSESERMIRLMVDREERVLELKREVNDLLARLGAEPRYTAGLVTPETEVAL
ncbi:MAG: PAS domain-containing protein [Armatimonadetes bacterium]|nr:PAS domain-containing protein [Armatimonadota bacterium]